MAEFQFTSPPGYGKLVPLQKDAHAGMGIKAGPGYRWTAGLTAIFLSVDEFQAALFNYPIAYARDANTGLVIPVAILGLGSSGNVFLNGSGGWRADHYVPAYVRRFPFCLTRQRGETQDMTYVCVQEDRLDRGAPALLDAEGKPTATFKPYFDLLMEMENAQRKTAAFTAELDRLQLLVPIDQVTVARTGTSLRLQGLLRVDDTRVNALPAEALQKLVSLGYLRAIYTQIASMDNLTGVLASAALVNSVVGA